MLKITWSPAVTLDGYIAKPDGNSDWVSDKDGELFYQLIKNKGCVIVGRRTYEQYKGEVFPVDGAVTFVWTRHPETGEKADSVEFVSGSAEEVAKQLEVKGFGEAVLAGGGETNDEFVPSGLVKEIIATIYPMTFGEGIKLLSKKCELTLELKETQNIGEDIIRQTYSVK